MTLVHILTFLWVLAPGSVVYVKGHSEAAAKVREDIGTLTCYSAGIKLETSAATLQVDHILANSSGRSWVVVVLTDVRQRVLFERKAEEYPWPLPSPSARLLREMAKSTCPAYWSTRLQKPVTHQRKTHPPPSLMPGNAFLANTAN